MDIFTLHQKNLTIRNSELISDDLLMDLLINLCECNEIQKNLPNRKYQIWNLYDYENFVLTIYHLCSSLKIDQEFVRYNTISLFELFLYYHIIDLEKEISQSNYSSSEESELWMNVYNQGTLRLISCLVLSLKHISSTNVVNLDVLCSILCSLGYNYSKRAIMKSELRVFKTVKFKINCCLLTSICPCLIIAMVKNESTIDIDIFYPLIYKVMDCFYLRKKVIFSLFRDKLMKQSPYDDSLFIKLNYDNIYLSAAIISVVPRILSRPDASKILHELAYITRFEANDISILRDIITDILEAHVS